MSEEKAPYGNTSRNSKNQEEPTSIKDFLEERLIVGAKIKIGRIYAKGTQFNEGEIITLIEGYFELDNGLYTTEETAPSIWIEEQKDFDSIYHLFGNDLERFMDCEILNPKSECLCENHSELKSVAEEMAKLIDEMSDNIQWMMSECSPDLAENYEHFYNAGTNYIEHSNNMLEKFNKLKENE